MLYNKVVDNNMILVINKLILILNRILPNSLILNKVTMNICN